MPIRLLIGVADPTSGLRLRDSLAAYCGDQKSFVVTRLETVGHFPQLEAPADRLEALGR